jgi:hypothetical protein
VNAGPPTALLVVSGGSQTGSVGEPLGAPITVKVTDAGGAGVPNQSVSFVVITGGGSVFLNSVLTDATGIAQDQWTLGTKAGSQSLEVRAIDSHGLPLTSLIAATAAPGPVEVVAVNDGGPQRGNLFWVAGSTRDINELFYPATDRYGNVVPNPQKSLTVSSPWILTGENLTAPQNATTGTVSGTMGGKAFSFTIFSADDYRNKRFRATWSCGTGYDATMQADSVRYRGDTNQHIYGPSFGTMYFSGTETAPPGAPSIQKRDVILWAEYADSLLVGVVMYGSRGPGLIGDSGQPSGTHTQWLFRDKASPALTFRGDVSQRGDWCLIDGPSYPGYAATSLSAY